MAETLRLSAPGSKSLTQRALALAALTEGESVLEGPLDSDDSRHLRGALQLLGASIDTSRGSSWTVRGGSLRAPPGPVQCGDGGTVIRFLAPFALVLEPGSGELILDGSPRLAERPLDALLSALASLGVGSRRLDDARALPVALRRTGPAGDRVRVDSTVSSQFASGLLMVAPRLPAGLVVEVDGNVSRPYLDLTVGAMRAQGAVVTEAPSGTFRVEPGKYRPGTVQIEGDWSGAAFLLAAGFVQDRQVVVENVRADSAQGDKAIVGFLEELRLPRPHSFDLTDCPDLLPPLAAAAVFASHPSLIGGVAHARTKECDRLSTLAQGFSQAGVDVRERPDALDIQPGRPLRPARLDPRGDHRMAMAFGLLGLRCAGLEPEDRACVSKSYPDFWTVLERLRA